MENNDWMTTKKFYALNPNIHASLESLRAEISGRHVNGLEDAILEKRVSNDKSVRPIILVSPSRYYKWLGIEESA